jgi:pyrimidine operon attenuation protein/uracil phosphoribosyltransferase
MIILNQEQIKQKIKRMAMEIYERHAEEKQIFLAGINKKGFEIACLLEKEIKNLSPLECIIMSLQLDPTAPTLHPIHLDYDISRLKNKIIILTDDVSNTGRTIFYAFKTLMEVLPKAIEVAVLVERSHKRFPVQVNITGLQLATTLNENIDVFLTDKSNWKVELT